MHSIMIVILLSIAATLSACHNETCQKCVDECAPFAVSICRPYPAFGTINVACGCQTNGASR